MKSKRKNDVGGSAGACIGPEAAAEKYKIDHQIVKTNRRITTIDFVNHGKTITFSFSLVFLFI